MSEHGPSMEALYSKLYEKYTKLKTKRIGELQTLHKDQELKFHTYIKAVEELVEHLKTQNERLNLQAKDLRSELASRSTTEEKCALYEKLLTEEKRKNKELSEELDRSRKLQLMDSKTSNGKLCTPASGLTGQTGNRRSERLRKNKRMRHSQSETEDVLVSSSSCLEDEVLEQSEKHLRKGAVSIGALVNVDQPESCRTSQRAGGCVNPTGQSTSVFQVLSEFVLGLKFSTVDKTEENCISAVHESSGYSFTLTWVKLSAGKEDIFRYRVLSLGTLEKVAPYWMKDDVVFSATMCPVFFQRISYLVK